MIVKFRQATMKVEPYDPPPPEFQGSPEQRVLWAAMQVLERLTHSSGAVAPLIEADTAEPVKASPISSVASLERFRAIQTKRVETLVRQRFEEEEGVVLRAFRSIPSPISPDALDDALTTQEKAWARVLERIYETVGSPAGARVWDGFRRKGLRLKAVNFSPEEAPWMQPLADYLRQQGAAKVVDITETTRKKLRRALADGIEAGDSRTGFIARLRNAYSEMSKGRADVIARNEVLEASAKAQHAAAEASGVRMQKRWKTAGDSRVREPHRKANNQTRAFDEPYLVGGERLMHPADASLGASPGNIILCRCTELYIPIAPRRRR